LFASPGGDTTVEAGESFGRITALGRATRQEQPALFFLRKSLR
jgi:hypothetical protein